MAEHRAPGVLCQYVRPGNDAGSWNLEPHLRQLYGSSISALCTMGLHLALPTLRSMVPLRIATRIMIVKSHRIHEAAASHTRGLTLEGECGQSNVQYFSSSCHEYALH